MATRTEEIQNEIKNLNAELNDKTIIMDDDWRAFQENKRSELFAELRTLPVSRTLAHQDGGTGHGDISYSDADSGL